MADQDGADVFNLQCSIEELIQNFVISTDLRKSLDLSGFVKIEKTSKLLLNLKRLVLWVVFWEVWGQVFRVWSHIVTAGDPTALSRDSSFNLSYANFIGGNVKFIARNTKFGDWNPSIDARNLKDPAMNLLFIVRNPHVRIESTKESARIQFLDPEKGHPSPDRALSTFIYLCYIGLSHHKSDHVHKSLTNQISSEL